MNNRPLRIIIADDHAIVRHGLRLSLTQEPAFDIIGEAENGPDLVKLVSQLKPDLVLIDWKMPGYDGIQAAHKIRQMGIDTRILLLSGAEIEMRALDALENGVDGFVHKNIKPADLIAAVHMVASGQRYLSAEITEMLHQRSQQKVLAGTPPSLSPREQEVLTLMATPATYHEIAQQLVVSDETVRTHVKRVMQKLDQPNRTQTVIAALRLKLIEL